MSYSSNDIAHMWAENQEASEADAFESALRATTIKEKKTIFEPDDEVEQAYRQGFHEGFTSAAERVMKENAELRDTIKIQSEQIHKLRECIARNHEDFYE